MSGIFPAGVTNVIHEHQDRPPLAAPKGHKFQCWEEPKAFKKNALFQGGLNKAGSRHKQSQCPWPIGVLGREREPGTLRARYEFRTVTNLQIPTPLPPHRPLPAATLERESQEAFMTITFFPKPGPLAALSLKGHADKSLNEVSGSDGGISSSSLQIEVFANSDFTGSPEAHRKVSLIGCWCFEATAC